MISFFTCTKPFLSCIKSSWDALGVIYVSTRMKNIAKLIMVDVVVDISISFVLCKCLISSNKILDYTIPRNGIV